MPPTFLYFLALTIWIPAACVVWIVAGLMALNKSTRPTAKALALAMAGTFPGVFLFQLAAAPVVLLILLAARLVWKTIEPGPSSTTENPFVIMTSIATASLAFITMLVVSLVGFYEGWRTGWYCAQGKVLKETWKEGPTSRLARRVWSGRGRGSTMP